MVAAVSRSPLPRLLARSVGHQGADREKTDTDGDRNADPHEAGSKVRPGASTSPCSNSAYQMYGTLGTWGTFTVPLMPRLEVLCNAADAVHTVFLQVVAL